MEEAESNDFQMDTGGFDEQKFLSAVASGNPPDLIYMDRQLIGTYANRGALQSLTSCIRNQRINMSQYRDAARREVTFKGVVYGIPEFFQSRNIIVNRPVLATRGTSSARRTRCSRARLARGRRRTSITTTLPGPPPA